MDKQFQPLEDRHKKNEFKSWEIHNAQIESKKNEEKSASKLKEEELSQIRQKAYEEGVQQGRDAAKEQIDALTQQLQQWIDTFAQPSKQIEQSIKAEIVDCIYWVCQHCINVELTVNPEKMQAIIEDALLELPSLREGKKIYLNAQDLDWIEDNLLPKDRAQLIAIASQDPSLERGEFYIQDDLSEVDGRLATRLNKVLQKHLPKKLSNEDELSLGDPL